MVDNFKSTLEKLEVDADINLYSEDELQVLEYLGVKLNNFAKDEVINENLDLQLDDKGNVTNWRDIIYTANITLASMWINDTSTNPKGTKFKIPKRSFLPKPDKNFHGKWIAEIPYQMMIRFTNTNDLVWSQFGGSGTDKVVGDILGRRVFINDLDPKRDFILQGDTRTINPFGMMNVEEQQFKMILSHPPYWDIVKYSGKTGDGSATNSLREFLAWFNQILENSVKYLETGGIFILGCGSIYKKKEELNLAELISLIAQKHNLVRKQSIIKDYGETLGSNARAANFNMSRMLRQKRGKFAGDNIMVFEKMKPLNRTSLVLKEFL